MIATIQPSRAIKGCKDLTFANNHGQWSVVTLSKSDINDLLVVLARSIASGKESNTLLGRTPTERGKDGMPAIPESDELDGKDRP